MPTTQPKAPLVLKSMRVVFHGFEHAQYFQGHGVSFTKYTHCATGSGQSSHEALMDALECLYVEGFEFTEAMIERCLAAQGDPTIAALEARADADWSDMHVHCPDDIEHENCELYYHVSIDVEIGE